jgi:hypothetical protein
VVIKGRDTTAGLASGWRPFVTVMIGGGPMLAFLGLSHALAASLPRSTTPLAWPTAA